VAALPFWNTFMSVIEVAFAGNEGASGLHITWIRSMPFWISCGGASLAQKSGSRLAVVEASAPIDIEARNGPRIVALANFARIVANAVVDVQEAKLLDKRRILMSSGDVLAEDQPALMRAQVLNIAGLIEKSLCGKWQVEHVRPLPPKVSVVKILNPRITWLPVLGSIARAVPGANETHRTMSANSFVI
jgi:hypothetical protein